MRYRKEMCLRSIAVDQVLSSERLGVQPLEEEPVATAEAVLAGNKKQSVP